MRKYPKKYPKCGEYMEPVFEDSWIGRGALENSIITNMAQQPTFWKCTYCDWTEQGE